MNPLSQILKDLADEYVMPPERFFRIWDHIRKTLQREDLPEPRMPNGITRESEDEWEREWNDDETSADT